MAVQILLLALIAVAFFVRTPQVSGFSMAPHIDSGEFVVINTAAYRIGTVRRGDIIAFEHDRPAPSVYLKRIVGLPGEHIEIRRGAVFVDGTLLREPYVRYRDDRSTAPVTVAAGSYYVLGDNRANSDDSRDWGLVPSSEIIGRAVIAIWPPTHFGSI
jgi:signal peptidase I